MHAVHQEGQFPQKFKSPPDVDTSPKYSKQTPKEKQNPRNQTPTKPNHP